MSFLREISDIHRQRHENLEAIKMGEMRRSVGEIASIQSLRTLSDI